MVVESTLFLLEEMLDANPQYKVERVTVDHSLPCHQTFHISSEQRNRTKIPCQQSVMSQAIVLQAVPVLVSYKQIYFVGKKIVKF